MGYGIVPHSPPTMRLNTFAGALSRFYEQRAEQKTVIECKVGRDERGCELIDQCAGHCARCKDFEAAPIAIGKRTQQCGRDARRRERNHKKLVI
jgi:hypothetical protein